MVVIRACASFRIMGILSTFLLCHYIYICQGEAEAKYRYNGTARGALTVIVRHHKSGKVVNNWLIQLAA